MVVTTVEAWQALLSLLALPAWAWLWGVDLVGGVRWCQVVWAERRCDGHQRTKAPVTVTGAGWLVQGTGGSGVGLQLFELIAQPHGCCCALSAL